MSDSPFDDVNFSVVHDSTKKAVGQSSELLPSLLCPRLLRGKKVHVDLVPGHHGLFIRVCAK